MEGRRPLIVMDNTKLRSDVFELCAAVQRRYFEEKSIQIKGNAQSLSPLPQGMRVKAQISTCRICQLISESVVKLHFMKRM